VWVWASFMRKEIKTNNNKKAEECDDNAGKKEESEQVTRMGHKTKPTLPLYLNDDTVSTVVATKMAVLTPPLAELWLTWPHGGDSGVTIIANGPFLLLYWPLRG
jgi:hypothetical protein